MLFEVELIVRVLGFNRSVARVGGISNISTSNRIKGHHIETHFVDYILLIISCWNFQLLVLALQSNAAIFSLHINLFRANAHADVLRKTVSFYKTFLFCYNQNSVFYFNF